MSWPEGECDVDCLFNGGGGAGCCYYFGEVREVGFHLGWQAGDDTGLDVHY